MTDRNSLMNVSFRKKKNSMKFNNRTMMRRDALAQSISDWTSEHSFSAIDVAVVDRVLSIASNFVYFSRKEKIKVATK